MSEQTTKSPSNIKQNENQGLDVSRKARADLYFDDHLDGQRRWYGKKAKTNKRLTNSLAVLVLASGATVSVIQLFQYQPWLPFVTAVLGAVVVLAKGLERIGKYEESWLGYRKASEGMKREYRLYINNAGDYANAANEDEAYRWFVEAVENVIAEEQNQFWESRERKSESENSQESAAEDGAVVLPQEKPAATNSGEEDKGP